MQKDFKFSNLTQFEIDTFNWETRPGKYIELDSMTFGMVWQEGNRKFTGDGYDRDYLFSWQTRDTNFIELAILTQDEGDYCDIITYLIYDKQGRFVDKFTASARCGDGGWIYLSEGKFINRNTYELLSVEMEMAGIDTIDNKELMEGDSTIFHYTIKNSGKVVSKEIYKNHFIDKW